MGKISKKFKLIQESVDFEKEYELEEALGIFDQFKSPKVTESLDIAFKLGIAADKSDQNVRGAITLPHSLGKEVAVAVFADGDAASSAKSAGAEHVGMDDLAEQFKKDEVSVDVVIATQAAMKVVGQLGQVLGPKGLMPNPKLGSVTTDLKSAIKDAKSGQAEIRNDKDGNIGVSIGKKSFTDEKLIKNFNAIVETLEKEKSNNTVKGDLIKSAFITSTMGVSYKLKLGKNI